MDLIIKYFPGLSERQIEQYSRLGSLYPEWNARINVISRKDIDNLYANHVLHSLAIAKFLGQLDPSTTVLDMGTGGGFPGIPLAVFYPQVKFHLIDRIGKKIRVAQEIARAIRLDNVTFQHGDIGECHEKYTYVVSRAVMPLNDLIPLVRKNIVAKSQKTQTNSYPGGVICLKGGDITDECKGINRPVIEFPVEEFIPEKHFADKKVVYVPFG